MPYQNEVLPIDIAGRFQQGRVDALTRQGLQQTNALSQYKLQDTQRLNALAQNPNATPEQYVRAGDTAGGTALAGIQQHQETDKEQSLARVGGIAKQALTITDPGQRKGFLQQALTVYGKDFQALGSDMSQVPQMLALPDDQLAQHLEQASKFATPQPIQSFGRDQVLYQGGKQVGATPPAEMTPYQIADLAERGRHNRAEEGKPSANSTPAGYEPDPAVPGSLRPIKGGPKDPDASTGMDSRSSVMFNRVAASAQAATKAISNIMELPVSTSSGWFGTAEPGHGLMASARNVLAQKVTGQEAQDFKTMVAGVSRNLSTIETAGLAPNGAITNSMNAVLLGEGDTQMTKLRKMAEMRQIVEENLKPQLANPKLAPAQKQLIRDIIGSVQGAVPFTHHDITLLQKSSNPQATIMDFATQSGLPSGAPAAPASGWSVQKLP